MLALSFLDDGLRMPNLIPSRAGRNTCLTRNDEPGRLIVEDKSAAPQEAE
jgi:hypothetical protein